ncbi:MAG TPA: glycoside hydrolase family 125 protein [Verrucomicrobiae bacterium]|nr:glycoside hydrolase family 125 protein [Verrucomicrobiae bacterium]
MNRRQFIQSTTFITANLVFGPASWADTLTFPTVRVPEARRKFKSAAVEKTIQRLQSSVGNKELAWMFGNCFPNTLDTTVDFGTLDGRPDTYVITGDIDAMWLRDSSAQVWPYLPLMKEDPALQQLIAGVINRQTRCILLDPYANAFYKDPNKISPWKSDWTEMKPGVHEHKWEVDSLCYPIRLAHGYWQATGDTSPFDDAWRQAVLLTLKTFREQQRKHGHGPYYFQRRTDTPSDTLAGGGYGNPARPVGMIFSMFRPSDDATLYPLLVPSNFFAVVSLRQAAGMLEHIHRDKDSAAGCRALADEVQQALQQYAVVTLPQGGSGYAYEVDGFGKSNCMDDANVPDLISLPYLGAVKRKNPLYENTRLWALSTRNRYYFIGRAAEGLGGPHSGPNMIWPLGLIVQGITATDEDEIRHCLETLQRTHAGTGFMHESFDKDDAYKFTRPWFAWANTMFGEFVLKVYAQHPRLLN